MIEPELVADLVRQRPDQVEWAVARRVRVWLGEGIDEEILIDV